MWHFGSSRFLATVNSEKRLDSRKSRPAVPFRKLRFARLEDRRLLSISSRLDAAAELQAEDGHEHFDFALDNSPRLTHLVNLDQFLTGPAKGNPIDIAFSYLHSNADALGLTSAELSTAEITNHYQSDLTNTTHLYLQQTLNGLDVENAWININVAVDGSIINVGSSFLPGLSELEGVQGVAPAITAEQAVVAAAAALDLKLYAPPIIALPPQGQAQSMVVLAPTLSVDPIPVELFYVPNALGGVELAWNLVLQLPGGDAWYDLGIDTDDGSVVFASNWVDDATYNVFPRPVESPQHGSRSLLVDPHDPGPSPFGWHDTNGVAGAEFTDTRGNNVLAQEDVDANNSGGMRPNGGASLIFDYPLNLAMAPAAYQSTAITNLFFWNNLLHDVHHRYGFTEVAGNFQTNNYGNGGLGNDAVRADAQDGSGFNNANFATPPDGFAPRMQQFIFTSTNPFRDSDLDNGIIVHEYGHGVSNRLTGGPANPNALNNLQSAGMGEGWSDFWALMFMQRTTDTRLGSYPIGTYVLGDPPSGPGIRRFPYSTNMAIDPLTLGSFNGGFPNNEVHNSGEIWASVLWDMNWLLINKHGFNPNIEIGYSPGAAGNILALRLVMDALKLQPANPSFIDARNAILNADMALTGGANQAEIWNAFARRGFGNSASTASSNSPVVVQAFDTPYLHVTTTTPADNTTVFSPPISFVVNFTSPYNPSTVQPSDFTVNGTPATGFVPTDADTITFTYASSPVISQGMQSMSIASGAITRSDNANGVAHFLAEFLFDGTPLQVVSTTPANGSVISVVPTTTLDLDFNEAIDPTSIGLNDLVLSQGTVSNAVAFDSDTARYTLSGLSIEGTLTVTLAAGTVRDSIGGINNAFNGSYTLEVDTAPLPVPLIPVAPAGSVVYEGSVSNTIAPPIEILQYASTVIGFSSETPGGNWSAIQALGPPDTFAYGDIPTAWSALNANTGPEFLSLGFATPVFASGVTIRETNGNGFVTQVDVIDMNDVLTTVWTGVDPSLPGTPVDFYVSWPQTTFLVKGVKIYVDGLHDLSTWEEIDSVQLHALVGEDMDAYTVSIDAGQTLAVVVTPSVGLQPRVTLTGPGTNVMADAAAAGTSAVLPLVQTLFAGTYTITVNGLSGSFGGYAVKAHLNAALEAEAHGGPNNDTRATAQDLAGSFIGLGGSVTRGAVIGSLNSGGLPAEIEPNDSTAGANDAITNFMPFVGNLYHMGISGIRNPTNDFDVFNIGTLQAGDILTISMSGSPSLRGTHPDPLFTLLRGPAAAPITVITDDDSGPGFESLIYRFTITTTDTYYIQASAFSTETGNYQLGVYLENSGAPPLTGGAVTTETEPNNTASVANDVSTSWRPVQYASFTTGNIATGDTDIYRYQFNAGDLVTVNIDSTSALDARVAILNSVGTVIAQEDGSSTGPGADSPLYSFIIPSSGTYFVRVQPAVNTGAYTAQVYLSATIAPPAPLAPTDFYAFTLAAGDTVTLALETASASAVEVHLQNSLGTVVAIGSPGPTNVDRVVQNFVVPATGVYYANVFTSGNAMYNLVIIRNSTFDAEPNNSTGAALPLGPSRLALGSVASADSDYYSVTIATQGTLQVFTTTPGDGPNEFVNVVDVAVDLFDPADVLVASDDNGAVDGRNAMLVAPVGTGTYKIRVRAVAGSGEYVLRVVATPLMVSIVGPGTVPEGDFGQTDFVFSIELSGLNILPVTVSYATMDGTATVADNDYTPVPPTPIVFNPGTTQRLVTVFVTGDLNFEGDEAFSVSLSSPAGAVLGTSSATATIDADEITLLVTSVTPIGSGVEVQFNIDFDATVLNLYDTQTAGLGPADLTLQSATDGPVSGSMIVEAAQRKVTFLKTGGTLAPGSYTLTVRSAANSFRDLAGNPLDGDANQIPGGDYVFNFVVPASSGRVLSIPDFVRGPGQLVNLPADMTAGIPLTINNGANVTSIGLRLDFDPALLTILGATLGAGMPPGWTAIIDTSTPGVALLTVSGATPLGTGARTFVSLQAMVPMAAPYAQSHLLDLSNLSINGGAIAAVDDDSMHVTALYGDLTFNGTYSGLDAARASRVVLGADSGFAQFPLVDPKVPADIVINDAIDSIDIARMAQAVVLLPVPEIPTPPAPPLIVPSGPSLALSIPTNLIAVPGASVLVPVQIDSLGNLTTPLESADVALLFDPSVFEVIGVTLGGVLTSQGTNWTVIPNIDNVAGRILFTAFSPDPLEGTFAGSLVNINFRVKDTAQGGPATFNLAPSFGAFVTQLNEGGLTINPVLTGNSNDFGVDGMLTVMSSVSIDGPVAFAEGDMGLTEFVFAVNLTNASSQTVTVNVSTADGAATLADNDYTAIPLMMLQFDPGTIQQLVTVLVTGDQNFESDEDFFVNLSGAVNANLGVNQASGTILNEDSTPTVSLSLASGSLAEAGGATAVIATLSAESIQPITVNLAFSGSAADGVDYTRSGASIVIPAGSTTGMLTLTATPDALHEGDEAIVVDIDSVVNGTESVQQQVTADILDDDAAPSVNILDASLTEGHGGTAGLVFTVELSAISGLPVTVNFAFNDGTATSADGDYVPAPGQVNIAAGTLSQTITLLIIGDTRFEAAETLSAILSGPVNATIGDGVAIGTIGNDDLPPLVTLSLSGGPLAEASGAATITATIPYPAALPVTVNLSFAGQAVHPADYTRSGSAIVIPAGSSSGSIMLNAVQDAMYEINETIVIDIDTVVNGAESGVQQVATSITNDDPSPGFSVGDVSVTEGNAGSTMLVFTVRLTPSSAFAASVVFNTFNGTATASDNDFIPVNGTLDFAPGVTERTVAVTVNADTKFEANETFLFDLGGQVNATLLDGQANGTIGNDDTQPSLSINDVVAGEGNSVNALVFNVSLSAPSGLPVMVNFATADGTALTSDGDYMASSGNLVFAPGVTSHTLSVAINGDLKFEADETLFVNLSGASGAVIADTQGVGTLTNDDTLPVITIADANRVEANVQTSLEFTVTLSAASSLPVTVSYTTVDNSATVADGDYLAASGVLTFAPGITTRQITVTIGGDLRFEDAESFFVDLSIPGNATLGSARAVGTIGNDDPNQLPMISDLADQTINEDASTGVLAFVISDAETTVGQLLVAAASSNHALVPPGNIVLGGSDGNRTVQVTPLGDLSGLVTITLTVSDEHGGATSQMFEITINPVNDPPDFMTGPDQSLSEDAGQQMLPGWVTGISVGPADESSQMAMFVVSNNNPLLFSVPPEISPDGTLSYLPAPDAFGEATVSVQLQDDGETANGGVDVSVGQTFLITIAPVNDAPVLDNSGTMSLATQNFGQSSNGTLVVDLLASAGGDRITDADPDALEGIAVTAVDTTNGTWEFSIDGGQNWSPLDPTPTDAHLLAADSDTRVRFNANSGFTGNVVEAIAFRAWDQTSGANGGTADTTVHGAATAFSEVDETAGITVAAGPGLDPDGNQVADALTDGVLILRYLFGFRGPELVENALAMDASRTDPDLIAGFLDANSVMLDVDCNGQADALTDGILVLRHLFGFAGNALVENALAPDATCTDPVEIAAFLNLFLPTGAPPQVPDSLVRLFESPPISDDNGLMSQELAEMSQSADSGYEEAAASLAEDELEAVLADWEGSDGLPIDGPTPQWLDFRGVTFVKPRKNAGNSGIQSDNRPWAERIDALFGAE